MADSITELILENLITTIEGVRVANGYSVDIYQVKRVRDRGDFTTYPAVRLWVDKIKKTDEEDAGWQICELRVVAEVWISDTVDPEGAMTEAGADIEKALAVDITRGGNAWDTSVIELDYIYITSNKNLNGVCEMTITITYEHRRNDPYDKD